jgi:hypothetical protein
MFPQTSIFSKAALSTESERVGGNLQKKLNNDPKGWLLGMTEVPVKSESHTPVVGHLVSDLSQKAEWTVSECWSYDRLELVKLWSPNLPDSTLANTQQSCWPLRVQIIIVYSHSEHSKDLLPSFCLSL